MQRTSKVRQLSLSKGKRCSGEGAAGLDDEFVKDVSEFDTLADLKKDVKEKLQQEADKKAQVDMENSLSAL